MRFQRQNQSQRNSQGRHRSLRYFQPSLLPNNHLMAQQPAPASTTTPLPSPYPYIQKVAHHPRSILGQGQGHVSLRAEAPSPREQRHADPQATPGDADCVALTTLCTLCCLIRRGPRGIGRLHEYCDRARTNARTLSVLPCLYCVENLQHGMVFLF